MNIVVLNAAGHTVVRPDTTLKKSSDDFYAPDFINRVSWSPVLFARISKPGKYIAAKFAPRHYDCINYGMLLYPEDFIDGGEDGYARACCFDHTSFLPSPMYNPSTLGREGNRAELRRNGQLLFSTPFAQAATVEDLLQEVSRYCYLRTGDLVCLELQPREELCKRDGDPCSIEGSCCGNWLMDFKIIF